MTEWVSYPENIPTEDGYYYTDYFNTDLMRFFYKAIYWNSKLGSWVGWRRDGGPDLSRVESFMLTSRHDYYLPCVRLGEDVLMKEGK